MVERAKLAGLALDDEFVSDLTSPDYTAPLHESRKFPYTIIPAYWRPVGLGVPAEQSVYPGQPSNEALSGMTVLKYNNTPDYRPKNLVEYVARHASSNHH